MPGRAVAVNFFFLEGFVTRRRLLESLALGGTVAVALAQTSPGIMTPEVRRIGQRLACLCGACNNTVADCVMLGCSYCRPRREQIAGLLARGMTDDAIVGMIVAEVGRRALAAPPAEGFLLLGWIMPWIAATLGLGVVWLALRKMRRPVTVPTGADPALPEGYRERIEKEMENFD